MSKIYAIADLHFGHKNLALHRGFSSITEHDTTIVNNWNKIINKRDTVYILGDITMERANYAILDSLKGIKNVILGNHDMPQHVLQLLKHVNKVSGMFDYKGGVLTHCPIHPMEMERYRFNLHGHIHEETINDPKYICVSCEHVNYTPKLISGLF